MKPPPMDFKPSRRRLHQQAQEQGNHPAFKPMYFCRIGFAQKTPANPIK